MAFTNLTLLQTVCQAANIEEPVGVSSLTMEQDQLLRMLDEEQAKLCGMRDWWFLQRFGSLRTLGYASGSSASVSGTTTRTITVNGATPFHATLTANGKFRIASESGESGYDNDIVRINYASTSTATVLSTFVRTNPSAKAWWYGQDEYALAADCDRVSFVLLWRSGATGTTLTHTYLEAVSSETLESIRRNRSDYFYKGTPLYYCVPKQGTAATHLRYLVLDPFPEVSEHILYGYMVRPTALYERVLGTVTPTLPEKYQSVLVNAALLGYYKGIGMGAPAGSPAGQDVQARAVEANTDYQEGLALMLRDQKIADERPMADPESIARIGYHDILGRSV